MPIDDSKDEIEVIECFNLYSDFSSLRSIIKIEPLLCLFDRVRTYSRSQKFPSIRNDNS